VKHKQKNKSSEKNMADGLTFFNLDFFITVVYKFTGIPPGGVDLNAGPNQSAANQK
jgi:hypothetical protein